MVCSRMGMGGWFSCLEMEGRQDKGLGKGKTSQETKNVEARTGGLRCKRRSLFRGVGCIVLGHACMAVHEPYHQDASSWSAGKS